MAKIQVGDRAPDFSGTTQDGSAIHLSDQREGTYKTQAAHVDDLIAGILRTDSDGLFAVSGSPKSARDFVRGGTGCTESVYEGIEKEVSPEVVVVDQAVCSFWACTLIVN